MSLAKYAPSAGSVLLVNSDREKTRVYLKTTSGVDIQVHDEPLNKHDHDLIDQHQWPYMRFKFSTLEGWSDHLPLPSVGSDNCFVFPWEEGRQAPVNVIASLLQDTDCQFRNIKPIKLTPEMFAKPNNEKKIEAMASAMKMDKTDVISRLKAPSKGVSVSLDESGNRAKTGLDLVIKGIEKHHQKLSDQTQQLLNEAAQGVSDRQLRNSGVRTPIIPMKAAEMTFLEQSAHNAKALKEQQNSGDLSPGQALTRLQALVSETEADFERKSRDSGVDIDVSQIEYLSAHIRSDLIANGRRMELKRENQAELVM